MIGWREERKRQVEGSREGRRQGGGEGCNRYRSFLSSIVNVL